MNDSVSDHQLEIGLASWIIQDGNYGDFNVGDDTDFALQFYCESLAKSLLAKRTREKVGRCRYHVNGEVIFSTDGVWVIDFGLRAFQEQKLPIGVGRGDFISAEIELAIDPFVYVESLGNMAGMPPLIYRWKIEAILQQMAPFIEIRSENGQAVLSRDETKLAWKAIQKTDAWSDDGGHAEYVLVCSRLNDEPRSQMHSEFT